MLWPWGIGKERPWAQTCRAATPPAGFGAPRPAEVGLAGAPGQEVPRGSSGWLPERTGGWGQRRPDGGMTWAVLCPVRWWLWSPPHVWVGCGFGLTFQGSRAGHRHTEGTPPTSLRVWPLQLSGSQASLKPQSPSSGLCSPAPPPHPSSASNLGPWDLLCPPSWVAHPTCWAPVSTSPLGSLLAITVSTRQCSRPRPHSVSTPGVLGPHAGPSLPPPTPVVLPHPPSDSL